VTAAHGRLGLTARGPAANPAEAPRRGRLGARAAVARPPRRLSATARQARRERRLVAISVVIPAYNEERGLSAVLARLQAVLTSNAEVVVVDDGSDDATAAVARRCGARVFRHPHNLGKGAALATALERVRGERIVVMDADDTYPVDAIAAMVEALATHDLVLGRRGLGRDNISPLNRLGNAFFGISVSLAAGRRIEDPLTGLYAFRRSLANHLALRSSGFGIEAEIVIKASRLGASLCEIPITYRRRIGESKLSPFRDGLVILRTIASLMGGRVPSVVAPALEPSDAVDGLWLSEDIGYPSLASSFGVAPVGTPATIAIPSDEGP
jgi:hypothetical protein